MLFSRFFLSLTAFTLAFSTYSSADVPQDEFIEEELDDADEEIADVEEEPVQENIRVAFPQKVTEQKEEPEKRQKPHYAGVRRPQPKPEAQKKTSKIKNEWFSSKTHPPKGGKKAAEREEKEETVQFTDHPYYNKSSLGAPLYSARQTDNSNDSPKQKPEPVHEGHDYPHGGFKAPDGHIYFTGEWLYWRTRQEGMEFAPTRNLHFDFESGYRVGLGFHLPNDFWDIYVSYTDFRPDHSSSAHGFFTPLFLFNVGNVTEGHAHWEIKYQNVDIEIGRAYYIAKSLTFRPYIGLKGSWIDQHANIHYRGGAVPSGQTYRTHFKNNFKGAGPLIGVDSNWILGAGFSFFGDVSGALVCGHFENKQEQHQFDSEEFVDLHSNFNLVSPTAQMFTGLAWDYNYHRDQFHFGIDLGFEAQYWWNQNQTEQFTSVSQSIYVRQRGDLAFYGLTLGARFDF